MRGLWLRLLRGGGRSTRLEVGLPLVAGAVITLVLLLLLGLQQGLDNRAERTAWRTPEKATNGPTAIQTGFTDYVEERPLAVVELAALGQNPPDLPGMGRFPAPGEVWVSPRLAELMADLPADRLAGRFPGPVTAELSRENLEHPDELVAVVGRRPSDPSMRDRRPRHQWNEVSSVTPTRIDGWSDTPDLYQTTYRDIALLAIVLTALPLAGLGGLASRLMAGRRQRRLATLRLLGARTSQVVRLTIAELATFAGIGAVCGAVLHRVLVPLTARVPIKGGEWFTADVRPGVVLTLATVAAVVGVLTLGALTGLRAAVRDPLGTYRRARRDPGRVRLWSVVFIAAAIALFWLRSSNPFVGVAFTFVVLLGWGLVSTGPWIVAGLGRLLAWRARRPATFLAGRRLSDSPRSAWRTVGGLTLASFIAGFVAISLPAGAGNVGAYASGTERLQAVVPAASLDANARKAETVLRTEGIRADVETGGAPDWLNASEWATLTLDTRGPDSEQDRARTAMIESGLWGPEMSMAEHLPNMWLLRDGVVIGFLILPTAALVALASMIIGAIARIFDQRDTFIALRLAGTPQTVLLAAQRREMILPSALLGTIAAIAGLASGATIGSAGVLNPYSTGVLAGLLALGAIALLLADRTARPVLERVGTDLSERE
ncbi:FtsX-like permease family protein [Actinomadura sp. KC06]|uniref:FtsX-like permease family protein n=1 Tax=Actinomadura sp. KC06 TaxID=2530369 RepID=UPI00104AA831|nr:FtsX-like permease family protein [Actinomadura sp. KC06]TDD34136.1 FtsX-like permease family protein [Actinomadura sp. KC06]